MELIEETTAIVAAYVSNNQVSRETLPELIGIIHNALAGTTEPAVEDVESKRPTAAAVRKSVKQDGLVSFIDGKTYKVLKRHLTTHGMTPASYRETFGLAKDYPMTCSAYSAARSQMAKSVGLGRKAGETASVRAKAAQNASAKAATSKAAGKAGKPEG